MVDWIRLHNKVKESASFELLSPSQRSAFSSILEAVRYINRINLYGEHGAGKTFIGWVLAREQSVLYLPSPSAQIQHAEVIVVDNAPYQKTQSRILYSDFLEYANSVILVTRDIIDDHLMQIQLNLTEKDLFFVSNTLRNLGGPLRMVTELETGLLWNFFSTGWSD